MKIEPHARVAIFTDLDGTLIRHSDYSFAAVEALLKELQAAHIAVVLASSKTRAEIEYYRGTMKLADPFVSENGGAIFVPEGYFSEPLTIRGVRTRKADGYVSIELGRPYSELVQIFLEIRSSASLPMLAFHEMSLEQIVRLTDLDRSQARLAARREFDEPFLVSKALSEAEVNRLKRLAAERGCRIVRGGRFYHLIGKSDKGRAVRILMRLYRRERQVQTFLGLGDSENDLTLLRSVDVPILLAKPDGSFDPKVIRKIPYIRRAPAGPEGWLQSASALLHGISTTASPIRN